ncbi:4'-phosphopantetheinyl transferase family protein [Streptomyces sp. NPDC056452]|uniref:4'-phosphopantetheinyl transferase family protein n=1 Tax=Streptomyces sp. NPDC056452 TaxID=3345821 RepID=UPI0036824DE4
MSPPAFPRASVELRDTVGPGAAAHTPVPPAPGPDAVHVWHIPLDHPLHRTDRAPEYRLDRADRDRADLLTDPGTRRRFVRTRGAVRLILAAYTGLPPGGLRLRAGIHGKPELVGAPGGLTFNVSHSGELALLAVARHRAVGVDVEQPRSDLPAARLAERFYPVEERAWVCEPGLTEDERVRRYVRLWTRKEAYVKAAGGRLAQGLHVPVGQLRETGRDRADGIRVSGFAGPATVYDVPVPDGRLGSVAVRGAAPCPPVVHLWPDGTEAGASYGRGTSA